MTNAATNEDTQTTGGLVITRNPVDGAEVTHFQITGITNGSLFQNNGTTPIANGDFITFAQANAGLKFTPAANFFGTGSFVVQGATNGAGAGLGTAVTAIITVNPIADTPSVTNATTNEDTQTTSGLVVSRNVADGAEVTHFKITNILNGTLFQNNGTTPIVNGDFITFAQGNAGLKFTPSSNFFGTGSFDVQASLGNSNGGLGGGVVTATITVNPVADIPSVTNAITVNNAQTTSGLVISRNVADGAEVTNFKITGITNGTLFQNDGTTPIASGGFITFAQGNAGLKFTPANNFIGNGQFTIQASLSAGDAGLGGGTVNAVITVSKANTTTTITNAGALAAQTTAGQAYAVTWSVAVTAPGSGTPTGNVTVTDGTDICTAPLAALTCNLTSTTGGVKSVTASYAGDANFNASTSAGVPHTVVITISGNIRQFPGLANVLPGVTVTLSGGAQTSTSTDASGNYQFINLPGVGTYTVTPTGLGKTYDPVSRTYTNLSTNITNADFAAYEAGGIPRDLRVVTSYTGQGQNVTVPIVMTSLGTEGTIAFSINYDINPLVAPPTVTCGSAAGACLVTTNTTVSGKIGITVTPAAALSAGQREVAKLTFQTLPTPISNTPLTFGDTPTVRTIRNAAGDPVPATYTDGKVVFALGFESDVAGRPTGDGFVNASDVAMIRQFVVGNLVPDPNFNEFQRLDAAPLATKGDGLLDATDLVLAGNVSANPSTIQTVGGPFLPVTPAPLALTSMPDAGRTMRVVSAAANTGSQVTIPVELDAQGNETAASFTLNFDPMKLGNPSISSGSGVPAGTTLTTNTATPGRVTVLVDSANAFAPTGTKQVITITFDVAAKCRFGQHGPLTFGNDPTPASVSSAAGVSLATAYQNGFVAISGPNGTGVTISGRVLAPNGSGLRNVSVRITDQNGIARTATTSAFGFYSFDGIAPGAPYTMIVLSRQFRFAPRTVQVTGNLTDVDFVGLE